MRQEYLADGLDVTDLAADPIAAFAAWLSEVDAAGLPEPNAMVVSTVGADGAPSSRMTLLKDVDEQGFVFFTNYTSRKAGEIDANPAVSLLFPWHGLRRQVIVRGRAGRVAPEESAAYFASRPHGSQLGAWASRQSTVLGSRAELDDRYAELARRWPEGTPVPVPDFWGGYRVVPQAVEFWQGRTSRLHDRLKFTRVADGWHVDRLAP
ncbi:MAG: pyridoxamine 5'-phosphate oxidase [Sporichthyaceae bacterium]